LVGVAVATIAATLIGLRGFSVRSQPSTAERLMARAARRWAVPWRMQNTPNPVTFSPEVLAEARAHFADHCATCHANDGSGDTEMGRNMYPRAPDMRLADTQRLTDGELYWIIENGIRLTGMPAWGNGSVADADTWKLVHFIRRLEELTPEQLQEMEALNPKSPSELEEERQDQNFLRGAESETPSTPSPHQHKE
jgi:mono/diheme cytochrome c family protein